MTTTAPPQAVMKAALQAYVDRTNAGDAAGLVALFAPDAVIEDPVGSPVKTYAEFARWFGDSVAFGAQITPVAPIRGSHGNAAALVFDVEFTPPGGERLRIRSLDVCTFNPTGQITTLHAYWGPEDVEPCGPDAVR
jgi:steroid delta-isomerase